jgi:hypothetical protein
MAGNSCSIQIDSWHTIQLTLRPEVVSKNPADDKPSGDP